MSALDGLKKFGEEQKLRFEENVLGKEFGSYTASSGLTYKEIMNSRTRFKRAGMFTGPDKSNLLDNPGHLFYRIVFHFDNGDFEKSDRSGGLLALPKNKNLLISEKNPTSSFDANKIKEVYNIPSAWAYLVENGEDVRASLLLNFINLLLNISINTPWYFQKVTGLDQALERKTVSDRDIKIEETRQKITIGCLLDATDNRIGTLLDLYRNIVFNWTRKCEVVPKNLRKFDMSIYIFESPVDPIATELMNTPFWKNVPSYKYIELHNCEIEYGTSKSGYGELNNAEGFGLEYNIEISYDDAYEIRYNQWMNKTMGDKSIAVPDNNDINTEMIYYWVLPGFLKAAANQLISLGKNFVQRLIDKYVNLGNLFTIKLGDYVNMWDDLKSGNVIGAGKKFANEVRKIGDTSTKHGVSGNFFLENETNNHTKSKPISERKVTAEKTFRELMSKVSKSPDNMSEKIEYQTKLQSKLMPNDNLFDDSVDKETIMELTKKNKAKLMARNI